MDDRWYHLDSKVKALRTSQVSSILNDKGIENIVLKGVAVERFYPKGKIRPSVDIDIAIEPTKIEEALELRKAEAFPDANVDFHKGLEYFSGRDWSEIYRQSQLFEIEAGKNIRILSDEDLLRLITIHWLADGGERKGRLSDIKFIIEGSDDFDWDYFLQAEDSIRTSQALMSIKAAEIYTDLNKGQLPASISGIELPNWVINLLESRWADDIDFKPLDHKFESNEEFRRQLKLRFPPNPLMATVALMKDPFKVRPKVVAWQYFLVRMFPSLIRNIKNRVFRMYA